jgi:hypothetical protein
MPYCIDPALFALATEICRRHGTGVTDDHETLLAQGVDDVQPNINCRYLPPELCFISSYPTSSHSGWSQKLCCTKFDRIFLVYNASVIRLFIVQCTTCIRSARSPDMLNLFINEDLATMCIHLTRQPPACRRTPKYAKEGDD